MKIFKWLKTKIFWQSCELISKNDYLIILTLEKAKKQKEKQLQNSLFINYIIKLNYTKILNILHLVELKEREKLVYAKRARRLMLARMKHRCRQEYYDELFLAKYRDNNEEPLVTTTSDSHPPIAAQQEVA